MADDRVDGWADLTRKIVRLARAGVLCGLPGRVERYSTSPSPVASVRLLVREMLRDSTLAEDPVLEDVPVLFPGHGRLAFRWTVMPGDQVWVSFSGRELGAWMATLQSPALALAPAVVDPVEPSVHAREDCVCWSFAVAGNPVQVDVLEWIGAVIEALTVAAPAFVIGQPGGPYTLDATLLATLTARLAELGAVR